MSEFDSLTLALEPWFDKPLEELPEALRLRAEQELRPFHWENLSPEQRRTVALQVDYRCDPSTEVERKAWWDFFQRMSALQAERERQNRGARANVDEFLDGSGPLRDIRDQIQRMKARERQAKGSYYPQPRTSVTGPLPGKYMAYPRALSLLRARLGATAEELAAWVFLGPEAGGLSAYLSVNELEPPPRFSFGTLPYFGAAGEEDADYVAALMGCWFKSDDVASFQPADRFITGKALVERWSAIPDLKIVPFVRAKIQESRLLDLHPIYGGTQAGSPSDTHLPPLADGLFRLGDVEAIEEEDFGDVGTEPPLAADTTGTAVDVQPVALSDPVSLPQPDETHPAESPLSIFRTLKDLRAEEVTFKFVGDRTEQGLAANSMVEISARGLSRRASLGHLGLVDRRTGSLNSQGAILIGMRRGQRVPYTEGNAKKVSRLRQVIRSAIGVIDPFDKAGDSRGWEPRFMVEDRRGAVDERERSQGERRTLSVDQEAHLGLMGDRSGQADRPFEAEGDAADDWLKGHDPGNSS